jgi:acyl dehydratase
MFEHRLAPQRWFEDFTLGEIFNLPSRTMTEAIFLAFQAASGDNHPIHYNVEFCRAHGMPHMLAHGFQVAIQTVAGAGMFPFMVEESLKAFLDQSSRFLAPVFVGDTLYPSLTVAKLEAQNTTGILTMASSVRNQKGVVVLDGTQRYLLRKRQ